MLKIAICDGEEKYINDSILALSTIEKNIDEDFYIKSFTSGQSLCDALRTEHFDIIMKGMSGIEAYKTIQELGKKPLIIYASNYDDNLKKLFGARIIAFMDKPIDKNELEKNIVKAIEIIKDDSEKSKLKSIKISIIKDDNNLVINVSNPYNKTLQFKEDLPITDNEDKLLHGLGLKSVRKLVEDKNGFFEINTDNNIFSVSIILFE